MAHQLGACAGQSPDGGDMFFINEIFSKKSLNVFKFTIDTFVTMHACYVLSLQLLIVVGIENLV
jgi:hypothetical protein